MEYGKSNMLPTNDSDLMGAIFMCNKLTKKECIERKLFGLHSKHLDFVMLVKTGMILFLFETDERKLFGVFQATSDGAMNIVPSAFSISKRRFPAQVCFERLFICRPLCENEFCETIKENYFTPTKFAFGLSSQQVCRLISMFSSRKCFPNNKIPGGLHSNSMKIYEKSNLARTRTSGKEKLLKFGSAGYNRDSNNIQSTRNTISSGCSTNHLTSYHNDDLHDITLQNHIVRRQQVIDSAFSHPVESKQPCQMLSTPSCDISSEPTSYYSSSPHPVEPRKPCQVLSRPCYDLSSEPNSYYSSSKSITTFRHPIESRQPRDILSTPLYDLSSETNSYYSSSRPVTAVSHPVESRQPYQVLSTPRYVFSSETNPYYSSTRPVHKQPTVVLGMDHSNLGENKLNFRTDGSLDAEVSYMRNQSYISPPRVGRNFFALSKYPDFDESEFSPITKTSQPTIHSSDFSDVSHPPPKRLLNMPSPSLCLRNARAYSRPIQQEGCSLSQQDSPSAPLPVPILEGKTLFNSSYNPGLKDGVVGAKESLKILPIRKKFVYPSGFTSNTNFTVDDNVGSIYIDKSSPSDSNLNMFSRSDTIQKKCSVFGRLSRSSKELNCSSLDDMLELLHLKRKLWTKANRKPENVETFETDLQEIDITGDVGLLENNSLTEKKPEEYNESNGFVFPNFKRRSRVKEESTGASDLSKCKKRKIIRPSFTKEDDDSSKVMNNSQSQSPTFQLVQGPQGVANTGPPLSNLQDARDASRTKSSQQTLVCQSEVGKQISATLALHEPVNVNSCDGKSEENSGDLPSDPSAFPAEQRLTNNSAGVLCTCNTSFFDGFTDKPSLTDADTSHMKAVKMDNPGYRQGIQCQTEAPELADHI